MKKTVLLTMFLSLGLLLQAGNALSLEIVYPADKTSVTRSDFLIIKGGSTPPLEGMTIELGGAKSDLIDVSSPEYRAAFKDFLILEPDFSPGKNLVRVEGFVAGKKVAGAVAEIYYQADPTTAVPPGIKPFVMHIPAREALCAPCHNMTPDKIEINAETAETNPCAACHRRMLDKSHVHGPAGVYRCGYCHNPDSKPARYATPADEAALCNGCHSDKVAAFKANKFVHGPVAAGLCLICHDPHASDNPAQMVAPINDVCLLCHENVGKNGHVTRGVSGDSHPLSGPVDPGRAGREFSCSSCHDPHGGNGPALLQRGITSRFALCQICHKK
jgi:predicted CXXCH cytochrome family protein